MDARRTVNVPVNRRVGPRGGIAWLVFALGALAAGCDTGGADGGDGASAGDGVAATTCGPGTRLEQGVCVRVDAPGPRCGEGTREVRGLCAPDGDGGGDVCGAGTHRVDGQCVADGVAPPRACGEGTEERDGVCVPAAPAIVIDSVVLRSLTVSLPTGESVARVDFPIDVAVEVAVHGSAAGTLPVMVGLVSKSTSATCTLGGVAVPFEAATSAEPVVARATGRLRIPAYCLPKGAPAGTLRVMNLTATLDPWHASDGANAAEQPLTTEYTAAARDAGEPAVLACTGRTLNGAVAPGCVVDVPVTTADGIDFAITDFSFTSSVSVRERCVPAPAGSPFPCLNDHGSAVDQRDDVTANVSVEAWGAPTFDDSLTTVDVLAGQPLTFAYAIRPSSGGSWMPIYVAAQAPFEPHAARRVETSFTPNEPSHFTHPLRFDNGCDRLGCSVEDAVRRLVDSGGWRDETAFEVRVCLESPLEAEGHSADNCKTSKVILLHRVDLVASAKAAGSSTEEQQCNDLATSFKAPLLGRGAKNVCLCPAGSNVCFSKKYVWTGKAGATDSVEFFSEFGSATRADLSGAVSKHDATAGIRGAYDFNLFHAFAYAAVYPDPGFFVEDDDRPDSECETDEYDADASEDNPGGDEATEQDDTSEEAQEQQKSPAQKSQNKQQVSCKGGTSGSASSVGGTAKAKKKTPTVSKTGKKCKKYKTKRQSAKEKNKNKDVQNNKKAPATGEASSSAPDCNAECANSPDCKGFVGAELDQCKARCKQECKDQCTAKQKACKDKCGTGSDAKACKKACKKKKKQCREAESDVEQESDCQAYYNLGVEVFEYTLWSRSAAGKLELEKGFEFSKEKFKEKRIFIGPIPTPLVLGFKIVGSVGIDFGLSLEGRSGSEEPVQPTNKCGIGTDADRCGAPSLDGSCFCDAACQYYGDCCEDYYGICLGDAAVLPVVDTREVCITPQCEAALRNSNYVLTLAGTVTPWAQLDAEAWVSLDIAIARALIRGSLMVVRLDLPFELLGHLAIEGTPAIVDKIILVVETALTLKIHILQGQLEFAAEVFMPKMCTKKVVGIDVPFPCVGWETVWSWAFAKWDGWKWEIPLFQGQLGKWVFDLRKNPSNCLDTTCSTAK